MSIDHMVNLANVIDNRFKRIESRLDLLESPPAPKAEESDLHDLIGRCFTDGLDHASFGDRRNTSLDFINKYEQQIRSLVEKKIGELKPYDIKKGVIAETQEDYYFKLFQWDLIKEAIDEL